MRIAGWFVITERDFVGDMASVTYVSGSAVKRGRQGEAGAQKKDDADFGPLVVLGASRTLIKNESPTNLLHAILNVKSFATMTFGVEA